MRSLLAACGTAVCSRACCLLLLCWCLLVAQLVACCLLWPCAAQQPNSLLLVASLLRGIAAESSLPIRTGEGAKGGVAPRPETRSDSPNRLVTNKPKAQLPAEKFSSHFSGPEATADLGGHPPAMCDDMGRCSLRVEPPHSVLARAPNQRSGTWPYAPPATSLWSNKSLPSSLNPSHPKTTSRAFVPRRRTTSAVAPMTYAQHTRPYERIPERQSSWGGGLPAGVNPPTASPSINTCLMHTDRSDGMPTTKEALTSACRSIASFAAVCDECNGYSPVELLPACGPPR